MLREDIPKVLFSCIKEDDPYRASKLFQIERWCYANWDLHKRGYKKRHNFLAQVLLTLPRKSREKVKTFLS